jgi:hypothetical protein
MHFKNRISIVLPPATNSDHCAPPLYTIRLERGLPIKADPLFKDFIGLEIFNTNYPFQGPKF